MDQQKGFLAFLVLFFGAITALMVRPFLTYVLGAVILGFVAHPLHKRLRGYTGQKISAFLLVFLMLFIAIVPFAFATGAVVNDAQDLSNELKNVQSINMTHIEKKINDFTGLETDLEQNLRKAVDEFSSIAFGNFSRLLNILANVAIGMALMLFLMYYVIKDGERMVEWTRGVLPMEEEVTDTMMEQIDFTTWAVIKGHVLVAIIQGLIAGLGLYVAGVPNYIFWTFIMVLLAFLPIVGSFIVWGPAALYLLSIDQIMPGIFLLVYGTVVVSLTDNFIRPLLVDKRAGLHPAAIIIGVMGGIYVFGVPGLFIGPITIGVFKSVLLAYRSHGEDL